MVDVASSDALQQLQNQVLEAIARGEELAEVARRICLGAEQLAPEAICTLVAVDVHGVLRPLAAPGLPDEYARLLDGVAIGPTVGSCGTAAWRGEPVEVVDIATDPLWQRHRELALPFGLKACWSSPIKSGDGRAIGTFAFYYRTQRGPAELERRIVERCVGLCAIAIEREETQSRIRRLAYFDALTGLPNREEFSRRAMQALSALDASGTANLLHIGLDDFKGVNDALGHRIGDQLLQAVARRFAASLGDDAFIARIGGDEFAILDTRPTGDSSLLATELIAILVNPFEIGVHRLGIGASIGIAQASMGTPLAELTRRADMAMVEAKAEGRSSWCRFEPGMELAIQSRRALKLDLRDAVDARAFTLVYQPIVVLRSNALAAVEVLVRWHHPRRGHVSPSVFIPIVEEMGLIGALGDWVLREACQAAANWPRDIKVCVNLSPLQFRKPGFVLDVINALREADLAPERLHLEVTESALLARDIATRTALNELHDLGVRLSLDDFGTGYSSLQSLRSFPFDRIKIDMSFVRDLGMDADSAAIIRSVIALARDLGMESTAEGVENAFQYEWLSLHGCSEGQGYWFGRPMDGAELQRLLERPERDEDLIIPGIDQPADV